MRRSQQVTVSSPGEAPDGASGPAAGCRQAPAQDAAALAEHGLRYVDDGKPGITRRRENDAFRYFAPDGAPIVAPEEIARLDALAIPPAYTEVWICPDPRGHIQATARDARGRKQYRYHPRWQALRDGDKYAMLLDFGRALPGIRRRVARDLRRPGLPFLKVIATVVRLLDLTLVRVGNREYARRNRSYGLTTLRNRHAKVRGDTVRLHFRGKSGVEHDVAVSDARVARIVARCMEIPGHELFRYVDESGESRPIDSGDVNDYLRAVAGADFTAKDYRTWAGSVIALSELQTAPWTGEVAARHTVAEVMKKVAARLGNTPAVCRKCYVHPLLVERYMQGALPPVERVAAPRGLRADERRLLRLLAEETNAPGACDDAAKRSGAQPLRHGPSRAKDSPPADVVNTINSNNSDNRGD